MDELPLQSKISASFKMNSLLSGNELFLDDMKQMYLYLWNAALTSVDNEHQFSSIQVNPRNRYERKVAYSNPPSNLYFH